MSRKLPILVYHHVVPDDFSIESFPPGDQPYFSRISEFVSNIDYLSQNNFQTLLVDEIGLTESGQHNGKVMALTFDDGQISDHEVVFPLLTDKNMRATFYIITDFVGKDGYMNWEQIREMKNYGMEIGSHSCSHRCLTELPIEEMKNEIFKSKAVLEDKMGHVVKSFSIPFGFMERKIIDAAYEAGYKTICTSDVKLASCSKDHMVLGRIGIRRNDELGKFVGIVEKDWLILGKIIVYDRVKASLKSVLGRYLWLRFRNLILSRRDT